MAVQHTHSRVLLARMLREFHLTSSSSICGGFVGREGGRGRGKAKQEVKEKEESAQVPLRPVSSQKGT